MHRDPANGTSDHPDPAPRETLHVVIAFGDLPAYKHALRTLVRMVHQLGEDIDLRPLPWGFEALADPASSPLALADARRASMVIIASSTTAALPEAVKQWVVTCCEHRPSGEPLLIGLLGSPRAPSLGVAESVALLRHAAARGGWHFLSSHASREPLDAEHPTANSR